MIFKVFETCLMRFEDAFSVAISRFVRLLEDIFKKFSRRL